MNLEIIIEKLRQEIINWESDSFSASKRGLKDQPQVVDLMVAQLIQNVVLDTDGIHLQDLEYNAQILLDPTYGSDEF